MMRFTELLPPTTAERVVAAVAILYPFRMLIAHLSGADLHTGLLSFLVVGLAGLLLVRQVPSGFPNLLDLSVISFALAATAGSFAFDGLTPLSLKGLMVETRFVVFYFTARAFRLGPRFGFWLLTLTAWLGVAAAVLGLLEYHLAWGTLLEMGWQRPTSSFWKIGIPRLYSFPMTPLGTAYLFVMALAAAVGLLAAGRRRGLVAAVPLAVWQALLLTLGRVPLVFAVAITGAFALWDRRRGRWFLGVSAAALVLALFAIWGRGWHGDLLRYAVIGGTLADGSAQLHVLAAEQGVDLLSEEPLGYGLGQAGHLAAGGHGVFPLYETHYLLTALQIGLPGLIVFLWVVLQAGWTWWTTSRASDVDRRAFGFAGFALWTAMSIGGILAPTWNMIVPQLYFWLLTGIAVNWAMTPQSEDHAETDR